MNFLKRFGVISKLKTREKLKEIRVEKFHVSNRSVHSSSNKSKRFDTPCFRSKKTRNSIKRAVCISHGLSPRPKPHHPSSENEKGKKKKQEENPSFVYIQLGKSPFPTDFSSNFPILIFLSQIRLFFREVAAGHLAIRIDMEEEIHKSWDLREI